MSTMFNCVFYYNYVFFILINTFNIVNNLTFNFLIHIFMGE